MAILAQQRPMELRGARRNNPPPPALTDAIAYAVGRTYGPGYSFQVRSGIVDEKKGTSGASSSGRHIMDGPGAADVRIFDPQGNQLAGEALTPLGQNWVSNFGSIGVNRTASETDAHGWTHMDLVNQPGKGQGYVWSYGGFAPGAKEQILGYVGKKAWTDGQPADDVANALYEAADATRAASVRNAPPRSGVLASLFGRGDLGTLPQPPQDAQSAIAGLLDPGGGTQVAEAPSPLMSFTGAPEMGIGPPPAPPPPRPPMLTPPQWAQNGAFPMAGAASTDAMAGGPTPPTPRLRNQSVLEQQRADQLDAALFGAGPHRGEFARARPSDVFQINPVSGAPDAASVPGPNASPLRPAVGGPNDRRPQPPMPNMRPEGRYVAGAGGAPDAGSVPNPSPRGTPYAPSFPSLYGEQPPALMGGMSAEIGGAPSRAGDLSAAMGGPPSRSGDMSAAMGGPPALPDPLSDFGTRDLAAETQAIRTIADANYYRPQNIMAPPPLAGGMSAAMGGPPAPPPPPDFTAASDPAPALTLNDPYANQRRPSSFETTQQNFQMPDGWTPGGDAPPPPAMFNPPYNQAAEWFKGNTPGYTDTAFNSAPLPLPPPPTPTPPAPQGTPSTWGKGLPLPSFMSQDQFNVSFAPGGPGVIADLSAPSRLEPATAAQGSPFDALLGPGAAMAAIPFNDVSQGVGAPQAASRFPAGIPAPSFDPARMTDAIDGTFAGGSVVRPPTPVPGQPGVVQGTMPGAMDIRPPAQGGPPLPPQALPQASPAPAPRQTNVGAERQRNGTLGRILGGLLGGPVGALGGGLLGGGGGGIFGGGGGFGFGGQPTYAWSGGGTTPGGVAYQTGRSNAVGGSNATSWQNSKGNGTVTVVQDPWTGTYYGPSYGP